MKGRKIILSALFVMLMGTTVFASNYKIKVKGRAIDTPVKVVNGRSMIGLRDMGEALGLEVNYDKEADSVFLHTTYRDKENLLTLDLWTGLADTTIFDKKTTATEKKVNR